MTKSKIIMKILKAHKYKNTDKGIYVFVDTASGREEIPINSRMFCSIIADIYCEISKGDSISQKTIKDCIFNYEGTILRTHKKEETKLRINNKAENDTVLRIDIGNPEYEYIEVTSKGWQIRQGGEEFFSRKSSQGELPIPVRGGDVLKLFDYCRIPEDKQNLFLAWIISNFIDIIHPCLVIQGSAGSGKSTLSTFVKMLIDPCKNNAPTIFPRSETELKDVYNTNYFVAYDNLQRLKSKQSDYLCSIVTGAQVQKRKLFENFDMCQFDLKQPILLNGISEIVTREDMLDRSIIIELQPFEDGERGSEQKIISDFKKDLPYILGGILDILVGVVTDYEPNTIDNPPRLVDFYEYGCYICGFIDSERGMNFCEEYHRTINYQKRKFCKNEEFKNTLVEFLDEENGYWSGTVGKLTDEIKHFVEAWETSNSGFAPKSPNRLSRELNLIVDSLKKDGIIVERYRDKKNCSVVELYYEEEE